MMGPTNDKKSFIATHLDAANKIKNYRPKKCPSKETIAGHVVTVISASDSFSQSCCSPNEWTLVAAAPFQEVIPPTVSRKKLPKNALQRKQSRTLRCSDSAVEKGPTN